MAGGSWGEGSRAALGLDRAVESPLRGEEVLIRTAPTPPEPKSAFVLWLECLAVPIDGHCGELSDESYDRRRAAIYHNFAVAHIYMRPWEQATRDVLDEYFW